MDCKVLYTLAALSDLEGVVEYSQQWFPESAEAFCSGLLDHIELLATFPFMGAEVSGVHSVRRLVHTPLVILYRVSAQTRLVEILAIRRASRSDSQSLDA